MCNPLALALISDFPWWSAFAVTCLRREAQNFGPSFAWLDGSTVRRYDEIRGLAIARKVSASHQYLLSRAEEQALRDVRQQVLALARPSQRDLEDSQFPEDVDAVPPSARRRIR